MTNIHPLRCPRLLSIPVFDKYMNRLLLYHPIHEPLPLLKHKLVFKGCVTFLLQPQSGSRPLVVLVLPHEGLVHGDELPGYLPVIFIHSQPAIAREIVPAGSGQSENTSSRLSVLN